MTKRMRMVRGSGNVFRDLGFREPEARNLALRSEVMIRIEAKRHDAGTCGRTPRSDAAAPERVVERKD